MEDTKPRHPTRSSNLVPSTSRLGPCTSPAFPAKLVRGVRGTSSHWNSWNTLAPISR